METKEAVNLAKWQLHRIKFFMDQASAAWNTLNALPNGAEVMDALNDFHNEGASIGHCLRWGQQAVEELLELRDGQGDVDTKVRSVIDVLDSSTIRDILIDYELQGEPDGAGEAELRALLHSAYEGGQVSADAIFGAFVN